MRAILAVCFMTAACGGTPTAAPPADCSVAAVDQQLLSILRSWYYWYTSIPRDLDGAGYDSPERLLSAVRQQQSLDRFSFVITRAQSDAFFGAGQYVGYGFGFRATTADRVQLTDVYAGSPADQAQMARGDSIAAINGTPVVSLLAQGRLGTELAADRAGVTLRLDLEGRTGDQRTVTLVSTVITQPSVERVAVLSAGSRRVGYVLFNSFIDTSVSQLDAAFQQLVDAGVSDIVVDLRYNGGGELSVAQHLATLIAGNGYSGRALGRIRYNDQHSDRDQAISFPSVPSPLGLPRVFFITTGASASASEFLINALRPYLQVVTVGATTFGKPVGENGFDLCSYALYPITFKIENAQGHGDYFGGLAPTCAAEDDLSHPLADPNEASLARALHYVGSGDCGGPVESRAASSAATRPADRFQAARFGWRQLINAY